MFKKVLLSEDIDIISQGILAVMETLRIDHVQQVQYCDDAYLKIKKADADGQPFDLLISDLSFKPDHRKQLLSSGEELIAKIKADFPTIKVIAYSIEDRPEMVRSLVDKHKVNAYVSKGRNGLRELEEAIVAVSKDGNYISAEISTILSTKSPVEINDSDIEMLRLLSLGNSQEQISVNLKSQKVKASSLSALEKRLTVLKDHFGASNSIHLVSIVKDLGII